MKALITGIDGMRGIQPAEFVMGVDACSAQSACWRSQIFTSLFFKGNRHAASH